MCEVCSKLTIKTLERRQGFALVPIFFNFEHILRMFWKWAGKGLLNTEFSNLQCISPKSYLFCILKPRKDKK